MLDKALIFNGLRIECGTVSSEGSLSMGSFLKLCEGLRVSLLPTPKTAPQGLHGLSRVPEAQFEEHRSTLAPSYHRKF